MNGQNAIETLTEVERVRIRTRRTMGWWSFAFLVFCCATLLSVSFTCIGDGLALGIYSLVVGAAGALIVLWGAALAVAAPANAETWAALGEGMILVGAGVWIRLRGGRPLAGAVSSTVEAAR